MSKIEIMMKCIFIISIFMLGGAIGFLYDEVINYTRDYNGLWLTEESYQKAKQKAESYEMTGRWVCVNIQNMNFNEAVRTCKHETAHEMFARHCQENLTKCMQSLDWREE